jgi:hypothetical protein
MSAEDASPAKAVHKSTVLEKSPMPMDTGVTLCYFSSDAEMNDSLVDPSNAESCKRAEALVCAGRVEGAMASYAPPVIAPRLLIWDLMHTELGSQDPRVQL